MSYETMDHAEWVEDNMAASRRGAKKPKRDPITGEIRGPYGAPEKLNEFQARFFDVLGMVGGGIYNAPISWDGVYWNFGGGVAVPWQHGHFATFDFDRLTRLVFLAHEARIRIELRVHGRGWLICGWPRSHDAENCGRHPNLDEAVTAFRAYLPHDHRIIYRPERDDPEPAKNLAWLEYAAEKGIKHDVERVIAASKASPGSLLAFDAAHYQGMLERDIERCRILTKKLGETPEVLALLRSCEEQAAALTAPAPALEEVPT